MVLAGFACRHDGRLATYGECDEILRMSKRKTPKAWVAYKIAKIGKPLGTVYGETEKEALANARGSNVALGKRTKSLERARWKPHGGSRQFGRRQYVGGPGDDGQGPQWTEDRLAGVDGAGNRRQC